MHSLVIVGETKLTKY